MEADRHWKRALAAVFPSADKAHAREQLTKLANERFEELPWVTVNEQTWLIRSEQWNLEQLTQPERKHNAVRLPQFDGPIVVVEFRGRSLLVDGTHRVNWWLQNGLSELREVLIVSYGGK